MHVFLITAFSLATLVLAQPGGVVSPLVQKCGPSNVVCVNHYAAVLPYHFLPRRLLQRHHHPLLFHLRPRRPFLLSPQQLQFRRLRSNKGIAYLRTKPHLMRKGSMLARLSMKPLSIVPVIEQVVFESVGTLLRAFCRSWSWV
jgi:hypothetical protein